MFRIYFSSDEYKVLQGDIEVEGLTLGEVETIALLECRKRTRLKFLMLVYADDLTYIVMHSLKIIGRVKIRSL